MAIICPTVTAFDEATYKAQIEPMANYADRIHIDLMDGQFAPTKSPDISTVWWPERLQADIHLMYQRPMDYLDELIALHPHMVIIHAEAEVEHLEFVTALRRASILVGLALLHDTSVESVAELVPAFDHVLIFSGNLGHQGGSAVDFALLDKVGQVRALHPTVEVGWDGGINDQNARQLIDGGVQVLNVGGFIQNADDPAVGYTRLTSLLA